MSSAISQQDIEKRLNLGDIHYTPLVLGSQIVRKGQRIAKGVYDFAVQGGAIGTISLYDPVYGKKQALYIPPAAIIVRVLIDVITTPTSGGSATIALTSGVTAADILAATAYGSVTGLVDGKPIHSAATAIKIPATTANPGLSPSIVIATAALTAGKFNAHIEYYLSDAQ